jgi:hypothetical protein
VREVEMQKHQTKSQALVNAGKIITSLTNGNGQWSK